MEQGGQPNFIEGHQDETLSAEKIAKESERQLGKMYPDYQKAGEALRNAVGRQETPGNAIDLPPSEKEPIIDELLNRLPDKDRWAADPALRQVAANSIALLAVGPGEQGQLALPNRSATISVEIDGQEQQIRLPQTMHPHDLIMLGDIAGITSPNAMDEATRRYTYGVARHHDDSEESYTFDPDRKIWRHYTEEELQARCKVPDPEKQRFIALCGIGRQALTEYTPEQLRELMGDQAWTEFAALLQPGQGEKLTGMAEDVAKYGNLALKMRLVSTALAARGEKAAAAGVLTAELLDRMADARDFVAMHKTRQRKRADYPFDTRVLKHGARILSMGEQIRLAAQESNALPLPTINKHSKHLEEMVHRSWKDAGVLVEDGINFASQVYDPEMQKAQEGMRPHIESATAKFLKGIS